MNDFERSLREAADTLATSPAGVTTQRLVERAAAEGLLDVAYASVESPLGPLLVAATPRGLARVAYVEFRSPDEVLEDLAARVSPRVMDAPARLDEQRRELDEFFAGRRTKFDLRVDWSVLRGFTQKVLQETARIDFGEVRTYADVAAGAGSPATAWSGPEAPWADTPAASSERSSCCDWRARCSGPAYNRDLPERWPSG
jgi:methylated-DNA-[protein]-cysteine S-methyltransferase